jgi:hypothetical protein
MKTDFEAQKYEIIATDHADPHVFCFTTTFFPKYDTRRYERSAEMKYKLKSSPHSEIYVFSQRCLPDLVLNGLRTKVGGKTSINSKLSTPFSFTNIYKSIIYFVISRFQLDSSEIT